MAIVATSEMKLALRIPAADTNYDAELVQLAERIEARLEGACNRRFTSTTHTNEKYSGDGTPVLMLENYPLRTLTSAAIQDEDSIAVADTTVIRYETDASSSGILELQARTWTRGSLNVTVTYAAGFSTVKAEAPDVWELILDASVQLWQDMLNRRRGVQSQSQMDGSISYYDAVLSLSSAFQEIRWLPIVEKYKRRRRIGTIRGFEPIVIGFSGMRI